MLNPFLKPTQIQPHFLLIPYFYWVLIRMQSPMCCVLCIAMDLQAKSSGFEYGSYSARSVLFANRFLLPHCGIHMRGVPCMAT